MEINSSSNDTACKMESRAEWKLDFSIPQPEVNGSLVMVGQLSIRQGNSLVESKTDQPIGSIVGFCWILEESE